jgi:tetratricopeptide (TPR) repeat protein
LLADSKFIEAKDAIAAMTRDYPGHRLTKMAAVVWARATGHPVLLLDAMDELLADFPGDPTFSLTKAAALRELGRNRERQAVLASVGTAADADPLLMQSLAQMLLADPQQQDAADRLLRRSVRVRPQSAAGYYLLASQWWEQQRFAEAAELYRIAACLDDREDQFADAYFRVAKATGQAPEALRLFQQKATRTVLPHPPAVRALFNALLDRDEPDQAFGMLDRAIAKLVAVSGEVEPMAPLSSVFNERSQGDGKSVSECTDSSLLQAPPSPLPLASRTAGRRAEAEPSAIADLRLFRAEALAQFGRFNEAEAELVAAKPLAPPFVWHKTAAKIARTRPDLTAAANHLREALALDPLWVEGYRLLVLLTVDTYGRAAAKDLVTAAAQRYPFSYPLARLQAELLTPDLDESAVEATEYLLKLCPHDAWAHRQLALILTDRKQYAAALSAIRTAGTLEPDHPSYFTVLAHVHRRADQIDEALEACRAGLRANVDNDLLIAELVLLSRNRAEKRAALQFVAEELHRQPHAGDGLIAYRDQMLALATEDGEEQSELIEEMDTTLERVLDARPDLWQAWSLVIQQHGLTHRLEEARELAQEATERFPLLGQLWADLARVYGALGLAEERVEALRSAASAAPGWPPIARELADALAESGETAAAVTLLERSVARAPLDPTAHAALADALWQADRSEEALERAKMAIRQEPGFDPAWSMVAHWSERLDRPDEVVELARELTRERPGDPRGWLKLARLLHEPEHVPEVLAALDTAIRLDPRNIEAHDLKAERLADIGRFEDALAAARPTELAADLPLTLQGRAAWIEAKRGNYAAAIPPMQALVSVEPNYYWGWHQLAEWYNETGRHENYLEATSELCRLRPEHPVPLTMRGEAKLKTRDRDGGKADLRDALRIAPQYAPAAAILFDACLADGEHRDARSALAVLQEHAGGPEVLVKQTQFAARTGDVEGALRALTELAETPDEGPPICLRIAYAEIREAGWEDRGAKVLREAWQSGGTFNPWAALYWLDTPEGEEADLDDRLAAVEAVTKAYPKFAAGYDHKAELLARAGRFEEALAACRPPTFGDSLPITLRGRAAWIESLRGNRSKAIGIMKQVVAEDPMYLWGWRNLAQWYDAEGRYKECLDAAERMVQLAPDDPLAYGYRGEARRTLGDRRGARADFQKAFDLDPSFDAAGLQLITEQLDADEVEEAARTLNTLREHATGPLVKLRAVQVAAKQGDIATARQRFKVLLTDGGATRNIVSEAALSLDREGWSGEVDAELAAAINGPDAKPAAAAVWADRLIAADKGWEVIDRLPDLLTRNGPAGREAVLAYATACALSGRPDVAGTTVHRFADHLRADTDTWARAGAALASGKSFALAASWLSDWRDRDGVQAWMLRPLADALRALDRDAEAIEVCRSALRLGGLPEVLAEFRGWLALDAAIDGRTAEAAGLLRAIDQVGLPDGVRLVLSLAEAVVMVQQAGPDGKRGAFAEARDHLRTAAGACAPSDVPAGAERWFKRAVYRLATDAGGLAAKLWAAWHQLLPAVREGRG